MMTTFEHAGLQCQTYRTEMGHWCGYVGVPADHPLHGKAYTDKISVPQEMIEREVDIDKIGVINLFCQIEEPTAEACALVLAFDIHGGITYAANGAPGADVEGLWWFGFDCAHAGDVSSLDMQGPMGIYRSEEYVIDECKSLADQLKSAAEWGDQQ